MSIPKFQDSASIPPRAAIAQVVSSIAMQELALSHILNAEGEKLQYVLGTLGSGSLVHSPTLPQLSETSGSVKSAISAVNMSQMFLMGELSEALSAFRYLANKDFLYDQYAYLDISFTNTNYPPFDFIHPDLHLRIPPHIPFTFDPPNISGYISAGIVDGSAQPLSLTIEDPQPRQHYFLILYYARFDTED